MLAESPLEQTEFFYWFIPTLQSRNHVIKPVGDSIHRDANVQIEQSCGLSTCVAT